MNFYGKAFECGMDIVLTFTSTLFKNSGVRFRLHDESNITEDIKRHGGLVRQERLDGATWFSVHVYDDYYQLAEITGKKYPYEIRIGDFISTYDVELNKYSVFIYILLHEIGHMYLLDMFLNASMGIKYRVLKKMDASVFDLIVSKEGIRENFMNITGESLHHVIRFQENRAEIFAMRHFKKVWDQVKEYIPEGDK